MSFRNSLALFGLAVSSAFVLIACDEADDPDAGDVADAGSVDGSASDSGGADASADDSGTSDSGADDAGSPSDGGSEDGGMSFGTAMSFFVSSTPVFDTVGSATTGDVTGDGNLIFTVPGSSPPVVLRGIEAADAHCAALAAAVGSPRPTWRAYLSTHGLPEAGSSASGPQIDARDRIGAGPWYNADGDVITDSAGTVLVNATLHVEIGVILGQGRDADAPENRTAVAAYNIARPDEDLFLMETGTAIALSAHDIFTGTDDDGRVYDGSSAERWSTGDRTPPAGGRTRWGTCNDWDYQRFGNAPGAEFAQVGHTDIPTGGFSPSWNSAHDTSDCTPGGIRGRGGAGHVYCFSPD